MLLQSLWWHRIRVVLDKLKICRWTGGTRVSESLHKKCLAILLDSIRKAKHTDTGIGFLYRGGLSEPETGSRTFVSLPWLGFDGQVPSTLQETWSYGRNLNAMNWSHSTRNGRAPDRFTPGTTISSDQTRAIFFPSPNPVTSPNQFTEEIMRWILNLINKSQSP